MYVALKTVVPLEEFSRERFSRRLTALSLQLKFQTFITVPRKATRAQKATVRHFWLNLNAGMWNEALKLRTHASVVSGRTIFSHNPIISVRAPGGQPPEKCMPFGLTCPTVPHPAIQNGDSRKGTLLFRTVIAEKCTLDTTCREVHSKGPR